MSMQKCTNCGYTEVVAKWTKTHIEVTNCECKHHIGLICPSCEAVYDLVVGPFPEEGEGMPKPKIPKPKSFTPLDDGEGYGEVAPDIAESVATQKAKGVLVLQAAGFKVPSTTIARSEVQLAYAVADKLRQSSYAFLRGCPKKPRHGFVDSKLVNNVQDAKKLWDEVREADPEGEMLVCHYVQSEYNAIWTPTGLTVGKGNDGATGGKGAILMPLTPNLMEQWINLSTRAGIDCKKENPYIEAVIDGNNKLWLTQLRAGPKIENTSADYVPVKTKVKNVINARDYDHMTWEKFVPTLQDGDVIWHEGGGLNCHHGIHAFLNEKPYVTSFEPKIGQVLEPIEKISTYSTEPFVDGLCAGVALPTNEYQYSDVLRLMALGLHNAVSLVGDFSFYLGASVALMLRLGTAAAWGEYRHSPRIKTMLAKGLISTNRSTVYKNVFKDYFHHRLKMPAICLDFYNKPWNSSFGGPKWGDCTEHTIILDQLVCKFLADPTQDNIKKVIAQLNVVVERVHNGGWWLNKFGTKSMFDRLAMAEPLETLNASPWLYRLRAITNDEIKQLRYKWLSVKPVGTKMKLFKGMTMSQKQQLANKQEETKYAPKFKSIKDLKKKVAAQQIVTNESGYTKAPFQSIASTGAQVKLINEDMDMHIQIEYPDKQYASLDLLVASVAQNCGISDNALKMAINKMQVVGSLSGSGSEYHKLQLMVDGNKYLYSAFGVVIFSYKATEDKAFKDYEQKK